MNSDRSQTKIFFRSNFPLLSLLQVINLNSVIKEKISLFFLAASLEQTHLRSFCLFLIKLMNA